MAELTRQAVNWVRQRSDEGIHSGGSDLTGQDRGRGECFAPPKRYRIGELIRHSGFSRQTIHNYTVMGLICEREWTEGGHRLYDGEVFETLAAIKALRSRYRLREIKRILDRGVDGS